MTAAPYTPETIRFIREHAPQMPPGDLARVLEWDVDRLRRVAALQKIDLLPDRPAPPRLAGPSRFAVGDVVWTPETSELKRGAVVATLPDVQGRIFAVLFDAWREKRGPLSGALIRERIVIGYTPSAAIEAMNKKLGQLRMRVHAHRGRGYHLEVQQ